MSDVSEKLQELQENIQKLQVLKQLGAEKLILEQEKEVYRIQQDIMELNDQKSMDPIDLLPKKCKFCSEKTTTDARLSCYEENFDTCKRKPPKIVNVFNLNMLRFIITIGIILASLFIFMLLTNILISYFPEQRLLVFGIAAGLFSIIGIFLRKPIKNIYSSL